MESTDVRFAVKALPAATRPSAAPRKHAVACVAAVGENRAGGYCKISGGHADDRT